MLSRERQKDYTSDGRRLDGSPSGCHRPLAIGQRYLRMLHSRRMHSCRILLDRSNNSEEHPCHSLIPIDLESEGLDVRILTCSMLEHGAGYSMINIFDGSGKLEEGKYDSEGGSCSITRMSKDRYMAMVVNKRCLLSGLINSSGCFLSSAIPRTDTLIEWTIIGPDSCAIHELFEKMRRNGYSFEVLSSGSMSISATLTPKQESYFNTAMDLGYYDIPKRITLDELSKVLGCSKSTLNVALRTAENSIFRFYRDLCRSHRFMGRCPRTCSQPSIYRSDPYHIP